MGVRLATPAPRRRPVRTSWLRHLLLGLSLVVVMLSIVGMHQLSVGHDVATGQHSVAAGGQHGAHEHAAASNHLDPAAHSHGSDSVVAVAGVDLSAGHAASGGAGLAADDCPTCGDHDMALGSCLLALTLLVLSWALLPPRLRQLPPFLRLQLPLALVRPSYVRMVPALSLAELSLRRT